MRVVNNLVKIPFNLSSIPNRKKVNLEKASTTNTAPHNDHGDPTWRVAVRDQIVEKREDANNQQETGSTMDNVQDTKPQSLNLDQAQGNFGEVAVLMMISRQKLRRLPETKSKDRRRRSGNRG